jgi:hypothetical protein
MKKDNTYPSTMAIEGENYQGKTDSEKPHEKIPEVAYTIHGYQESRDGEIKCLTFYLLSHKDNGAYGYSPSNRKVYMMWPNADHFPNQNFHNAPKIPFGKKMAIVKDFRYLDDAYRNWRYKNQKTPIEEFWKQEDVSAYIKSLPDEEPIKGIRKNMRENIQKKISNELES